MRRASIQAGRIVLWPTLLGPCLMLLLVACGGGTAGDVARDEPPWGLDRIDMPDTVEEVEAAIAAFPDEIEGKVRSGGGIREGSASVAYGMEGILWIIGAQPTEQIEMLGMPGVRTPTDYVRFMGDGKSGGVIEERALEEGLLWVASHEEWQGTPAGTAYYLTWAEAGGDFVFFIQAGSEAGRVALVEAFITAAGL